MAADIKKHRAPKEAVLNALNAMDRKGGMGREGGQVFLQSQKAISDGLTQVISLPGGSRTQYAISCLNLSLEVDPPSPTSGENGYYVFISDEGYLYPPALQERKIPLFKMLLVKTRTALETWVAALEAIQSGLFGWVFLRPSSPCTSPQLRKLQLAAERNHAKVFILLQKKLPHWMLKSWVEV